MGSKHPPAATLIQGRCPICGSPSELATRPFCSKRCRDIDLSRWLKGAYAIPGGQAEADEDGDEAALRSGGPHTERPDDGEAE